MTHVDQVGIVAVTQVVQNRRLVEVGKLSHVLALVKLGGVHGLCVVLVDGLLLQEATVQSRTTLKKMTNLAVGELDGVLLTLLGSDRGGHAALLGVNEPDPL